MASARGLYGMGSAVDSTNRQMDDMRRAFTNVMNASKAYEVRQVKTVSLAEDYSKRLKEQKVHMWEAIKQRKLMGQVIKDQIALEKAQAVAWRTDSSGRTTADLIMPKEGLRAIDSARISFGVLNQAVNSAADNMVKWGKNTQWAGRQLTVGFSVPMGMAAAATGKLAYEMDKSLTNITKVYGDANTALQETSEGIRANAMQTATNMAALYGQSAKDTLEIQAQFAAAGKTGVELQNATAAATRARMLNEIDLQTAIQASITMQTVYGYSAEELGQKWDYINAVANQTVLGAEDFAIAIPKVSGVLKEMGADLEDVGVLMTAFKSAGIDAAEGANALKTISFRAVSAYGKGLDTFTKMTGEDLTKIVKQTNGDTIPTLLAMYKAMEGLSTPQKIAVVKDVFGIYQGNKALILLQQLAAESEQVAQAMAVGDNSIAENAKIANQELARMNAQPFKKIQKAVESIKIQMAEMGKAVLPLAASFLNGVKGLLEWVNGLDAGAQKAALVIAAAIGLAGPLTMLLGLFANLGGNVIKMFGAFGNLITRFKIVDAQERAQVLLAKQMNNSWDTQTSAVARLVFELQAYNKTMQTALGLQGGAAAGAKKHILDAAIGRVDPAYTRTASGKAQVNGKFISNDEVMRLDRAAAIQTKMNREQYLADKKRTAWSRDALIKRDREAALAKATAEADMKSANARNNKIQGISGGVMAAGAAGAMFANPDTIVGKTSEALMAAGMLSMLFPQIGASIIKNISGPMRIAAANVTGLMGNMKGLKGSVSGLGASMKGFASAAALPLAAAGTAALVFWQKVQNATDEAVEKAKAYNETARLLGEQSNVNWNSAVGMPTEGKTGQDATYEFAAKFREANKAAADALVSQGEKTGDQWGVAISKGVEVKLHGGTVEAAKQATRTALEIMGQTFSDAEFETKVNVAINFENPDAVIRRQLQAITDGIKSASGEKGTGMQGFARDWLTGQNDLTEQSRESVDKLGKDFFQTLRTIDDPRQRQQILGEFVNNTSGDLKKAYDQLARTNNDLAKKDGKVMGFGEFLKSTQYLDDSKMGDLQKSLNMTREQATEFQRQADTAMRVSQAVAVASGKVSQSSAENTIFDPKQLEEVLKVMLQIQSTGKSDKKPGVDIISGFSDMAQELSDIQDKAAQKGHMLSDAEKLVAINVIRAKNGMAAATSVTQGFAYAQIEAAEDVLTLAESIDKLGMATTEDQITGAYRGTMEKVNSDLFDAAVDSLSREADMAADAIDNEMQGVMDSFDRRSDAMDKKYDSRADAQEKKQEQRKKKIDDYYDGRIKGIQAVIDAEKAAEDARQKIFEAEKKRIERLADMYNRNVDFNSALNTGNLDEAAKISNDARAQNESWLIEDSSGASQSTSDLRIAALEKQKDALAAAKDARLKSIEEVDKREDESLDKARDNARARLDAERKASQQSFDIRKKNSALAYENAKYNMQRELDTLRAYIPRNNAELVKQRTQIEAVYAKYGQKLTDHGNAWSGIIGRSLTQNVATSANELRTAVNWTKIGTQISEGLIKGGFGMSAKQFAAWLNGGEAPKGTLFSPTNNKAASTKAHNDGYGSGITRHKGGIINDSKGSRAGHSGQLSQSEVMVRALRGESVLTRRATDLLGEENINSINAGKLPANTGPWGATGLGAAMMAGAAKRVMGQVINTVAQRKLLADAGMDFGTGAVAGKAGKYGGVSLSAEQLSNAAAIVGVGKSLGATQRDLVIALMTAMQESTLRNLNYGDLDSLGLFQQRNEWGSAKDRTTPAMSARMFFLGGAQGQRGLFDFPNRDKMTLGQAAQAVQVSAFPDAYDKWQAMATAVLGGTATSQVGQKGIFGAGINMAQYGMGGSGTGGWTMPAKGPVTSRFGMRVNPVTGVYRLHAGSDIGAPSGSPIFAARGGRVVSANGAGGYGNYTIIDHGQGLRTAYAHQSSIGVKAGQLVSAGQVIGRVGSTGNSTGPHLHFEYMKDGNRTNPNTIIPGLSEGGYTLNTGLARLHDDEAVLTAPLTQQLHQGIDRFAKGEGNGYTINMDFRGATVDKNTDIEGSVTKAIQKAERRRGVVRRIK